MAHLWIRGLLSALWQTLAGRIPGILDGVDGPDSGPGMDPNG